MKETVVKERARPKPSHKTHQKIFSEAEMQAFKNLRLLREEMGLTQKVWASELGFGHTYVRAYESGRYMPSYGNLIAIANYCNVSLDWIFGRTKVRLVNKKSSEPLS